RSTPSPPYAPRANASARPPSRRRRRCAHSEGHRDAGTHRRLRARALLRALGVRGGASVERVGCRGLHAERAAPARRRRRQVPLGFERGWQLNPDEVARAVSGSTRLIAINFPHNPTGAHITADVQRRLVEIAESSEAVLLSDVVYRGLEYPPGDKLPAAADLS